MRLLFGLVCLAGLKAFALPVSNDEAPAKGRFVSINLCSDRLLQALASNEQIAALSSLATDPTLNLALPDEHIDVVEGDLLALLPYYNDTIVIFPELKPALYAQLESLGFNLLPLAFTSDEAHLLDNINTLADALNQPQKKAHLMALINTPQVSKGSHLSTLVLTHGLSLTPSTQQAALLKQLSMKDLASELGSRRELSIQTIYEINPDMIILSAAVARNEPVLAPLEESYIQDRNGQEHFQLQQLIHAPLLAEKTYTLPQKYMLCYDHGISLAAKAIEDLRVDIYQRLGVKKNEL